MSSLREELGKVNERLSRLENGKQQETASTNQVNVNSVEKGKNSEFQIRNPNDNRGLQNAYERARKDTTRNFDQ